MAEGNKLHQDIDSFYNGVKVDNDSKEFQQFKEFNAKSKTLNLKPYRTE